MSKKRILIITYYWPPSGGSGVQRWVYFSKYLNRLGVDPIILTVDPKYATYPSLDTTLQKEVEGIKVIRTKSFEPLQLYSKLITGNKKDGVPFGDVNTKGKSIFKKTSAFVRGNFILPDARKYWMPYAYKAALEIISKEKIDLIISTGPPHSTHLIAQKIKKTKKIPWISDFRDPWTEVFYNKDLYRTKWAIKKDERMEKSVIHDSDAVICVSNHTSKMVREKSNEIKKVNTIINGYDHELLKKVPAKERTIFTIAYVGYLGRHHMYQLFIDGIMKFSNMLSESEQICLSLAGRIDEDILSMFKNIPRCKVEYDGIISHDDAIASIKGADVLLISIPFSTYSIGNIPGKLLEYIATGNPIILVGQKESDAANILQEFDRTITLSENEVELFAEFCSQVYYSPKQLKKIREEHKLYTREATANQLFELIVKLTTQPAS